MVEWREGHGGIGIDPRGEGAGWDRDRSTGEGGEGWDRDRSTEGGGGVGKGWYRLRRTCQLVTWS